MIWVAWRQFRTQALVTAGLLAAFAALVLITGLDVRDLYNSLGGAHCGALNDCTDLNTRDRALERALAGVLGPALIAVPALIGMFWGAPLIARELESGTFRLAWTQSITRRRWLITRIVIVGVAGLAVAGLASWLVSWWFAPFDAVNMNRFEPSVFDVRGIVAIGYTGFAFALGVAAGALTRRTLPAMAATLLGFVAARFAFTLWVRPHLLPAREALFSPTFGKGLAFIGSPTSPTISVSTPPLPNAWAISATLVDRAGHALSAAQLHGMLLRYCPTIAAGLPKSPGAIHKGPGGLVGGFFINCMRALSPHMQVLVAYQPPSHYWPLQALETGIFLAVALALIGATVWRIGRRNARKPPAGDPREQAADPPSREAAPEIGAQLVRLADAGGRSTRRRRHRTPPNRRPRPI